MVEEREEEDNMNPRQKQPEQVGDSCFRHIEIRGENARKFRNFNIFGREASVRILPSPLGADIVDYFENASREIHAYVVNSSRVNDYVGVSFASTELTRGPAGLLFRPVHDLTHADIWNLVSSLAQSAGGHDIVERFEISVYNVTTPSGRGRNKLTSEDVAKRSIVNIENKDNLCFPRSLVVAYAYCERGNVRTGGLQNKWNAVRRQNSSLQRELAIELTRNAGVTMSEEGCGIPEIERFQRYLAENNIAIVVYNFSTFACGKPALYDGCEMLSSQRREIKFRLNIMYYEKARHFKPILNLKSASGYRSYCVRCNRGYCFKYGHRCSNTCPRCLGTPSCERVGEALIRCGACMRTFYGERCFERHRVRKSKDGKPLLSVCQSVRFCKDCGGLINSRSKHSCGEIYCRICCTTKPINHLCYMRPLRSQVEGKKPNSSHARDIETEYLEDSDDDTSYIAGNDVDDVASARVKMLERRKGRSAFIFYDFETRQDDILTGTESVKTHVVTLCVAQQICENCMGEEEMSTLCRWCGVREFVFRDDPVKQFVDFATRKTNSFTQIICIAHNASAFDLQFILRYMVESGRTPEPHLILSGTRIILLSVGQTKFIDSINYMPMRLSALPKAFGLKDTVDKGIFPHLFNTRENQGYVGPLPDVKYYTPNTMKTDERERFLTWHAEMRRKNFVFDFEREIVQYC